MAKQFGIKRSESAPSNSITGELIEQVKSLFSDTNAVKPDEGQGSSEPLDSIGVEDDVLIKSANKWKSDYEEYFGGIKDRSDGNKQFWLGTSSEFYKDDSKSYDNVIFEAVETLLPLICKQNPEPAIKASGDNQEAAVALSELIMRIADDDRLKSKIRLGARHWMLDLLGVFKATFDLKTGLPTVYNVLPENIILDKYGTFDGAEFKGAYIGEKKKETAKNLIARFPEHEEEIASKSDGNQSKKLDYEEWWSEDFVFWKMGNVLLGKAKNPYFDNGDEPKMMKDEMGQDVPMPTFNVLPEAKFPYAFMWMFNTGRQPHDETSLIEQCGRLQTLVSERTRQIGKNADDANNGWVFSAEFSDEQAKEALDALRKGGAIRSPAQRVGDGVQRFPAAPLPTFIFDQLIQSREQIRNIMGVRGSSAAGIVSDRTVQGKIEIKAADSDRVSPIVEQVEQVADFLYNMMAQMVFLLMEREKIVSMIGIEKAQALEKAQREGVNMSVSVKEGSAIPFSPLLRRNEAVEMATAGLLDPITMFERMDYPDAEKAAERLMLYKTNPAALLPPPEQPIPEPPLV